jgi:hypothetical protein
MTKRITSTQMNNLYVFYKLYWILRDTGKRGTPIISKGFMRQTSSPWMVGKGIQFRFGKHTLQVGICGDSKSLSDDDGLLYAMEGRVLDSDPEEIRSWR